MLSVQHLPQRQVATSYARHAVPCDDTQASDGVVRGGVREGGRLLVARDLVLSCTWRCLVGSDVCAVAPVSLDADVVLGCCVERGVCSVVSIVRRCLAAVGGLYVCGVERRPRRQLQGRRWGDVADVREANECCVSAWCAPAHRERARGALAAATTATLPDDATKPGA
jgi:hypothetical protein